MPIEWIAISATLAPHLSKYAADRADRLADNILARTYRKIVPVGKLVKANEAFVSRFSKELDSATDLSTLNAEPYQVALQEFLQNPTVQDVVQAPLDGHSELDWQLLRGIWHESHYIDIPDDFDWTRVAKTYQKSVTNQMLTDPELRTIVTAFASMRAADLAERGAVSLERLAGLHRSFDLDRYAQALSATCAHLKLGSLSSDWPQYERSIRLRHVFVPQSVKQALPPRDITRDYLRSLKERNALHGVETDDDGITKRKHEYARTESRNVLEVVDQPSHDRLVLLGDPGLGKSTLLKLLVLRWVEDRTRPLTLFVELRRAGRDSGHQTFLDYFEAGSHPFCCLPKLETHSYLQHNDSLVLFDGLDEVAEPYRSELVNEIIRFGSDYPKARMIVTTRVYGYFPGSTHPEEFRAARFQQFTLQDFDGSAVHRFIALWHEEAFVEASSRSCYENRLRDAIHGSPAIGELAANPLLLTMMAVLSRSQDLPRDRGKLYAACAELLMKNWDLDKFPDLKRRKEPRDIRDRLGPDQKMRILEKVAKAMQNERTGIEGNLIAEERLKEILVDEMRVLEVPQAWSVTEDLIEMLQDRDFMLAYLGDRQYAFVHRTFLEYFSARDLKFQLERTRTFTESDLYRVFREKWNQEAWQEVLRLLCGIIGAEFAEGCIREICNGPHFLDKYFAFLRWWAALKMKESQCPERVRVTRQA